MFKSVIGRQFLIVFAVSLLILMYDNLYEREKILNIIFKIVLYEMSH